MRVFPLLRSNPAAFTLRVLKRNVVAHESSSVSLPDRGRKEGSWGTREVAVAGKWGTLLGRASHLQNVS